jgi:hypothetical protein
MFTLLFLAPLAATLLSLLAMLVWLPYAWARLEAPYAPESSDGEAWAAALDHDLEATPQDTYAVYTRCIDLGIAPNPWAMPLALQAALARTMVGPMAHELTRAHTQMGAAA